MSKQQKQQKKKPSNVKHVVPKIKGKGDYTKPSSSWGKWAAKTGSLGGDLLSHIFGNGDYSVKYNSLMDAGGPPQFSRNKTDRSTVVRHREYVGDITGSIAFTANPYPLSPSTTTLFPWLSSLAGNYEEYRIHGMVFEFKSTSATAVNSTNTALGTVIMATQYDPLNPPFISKIQMENYEYSTSACPTVSVMHGIECAPHLTVAPQLYVDGALASGAVRDLRLTQFGTFYLATVGMQAAAVVGELWVSYEIELLKPKLGGSMSCSTLGLFQSSAASGQFFSVQPTVDARGGGVLIGNAVGSTILSAYTVTTGSSTAITFNDPRLAGKLLQVVTTSSATTVSTNPIAAAGAGVTFVQTDTTAVTAATGISVVTLLCASAPTTSFTFSVNGPTATGVLTNKCVVSVLN